MCTLATGLMIAGLGLVITWASFLVAVNDHVSYGDLAFNTFLGVKWAIWIFAAFAIVCGFILSRTRFGRWVYAVGGNVEAARLSGINTRSLKIIAFGVSWRGRRHRRRDRRFQGAGAGAQAGDGIQMVLQASLPRSSSGGTSVAGGRGAVGRMIFGVLFLALISNGFNLLSG